MCSVFVQFAGDCHLQLNAAEYTIVRASDLKDNQHRQAELLVGTSKVATAVEFFSCQAVLC